MSDMLSQAEIDALLSGANVETNTSSGISSDLTAEETDALGEIGNISMGTSATTLSALLSQKVSITTPKVTVMTWKEIVNQNSKSYVVVKVMYKEGLLGTNLLILNANDAKTITNLMMGGQASQNEDGEVSELELSAICEAMNQMVGSASTSISSMIGKKIDISPPTAQFFNFSTDIVDVYNDLSGNDMVVRTSFRMTIGDLIDSEIMQIIPITFAKELVSSLLALNMGNVTANVQPTPQVAQQQTYATSEYVAEQPSYNYQSQVNSAPAPTFNYKAPEPPRIPVNVQPVQFQSLEDVGFSGNRENIGLIMDVPLQVTVELGRTNKLIRDILEFGTGSIVELDKLAGEPVDILVNGKRIAKGEVVVIDENFGVRITDIVHPSKRL